MDKVTDSWFFSKEGIGGIKSGNIQEFETWLITKLGADDSQIMLTSKTVQEMFESFKKAKEENKPFRFNLRLEDRKALLIKTKTGDSEQLQIRFKGDYVENYNPNKINSAKQDYFEIYLDWKHLPEKFKKAILNN